MVAWWGNPHFMIFGLFSMLLNVKWSVESSSTYFWRPDEIDVIMAVFSKKKNVDKIENYTNGGIWWGNLHLMIIGLFLMLLYVKWSVESDFPLTFNCQIKLMELWQFFHKKKVDIISHNSINFVRQSKVNGKLNSRDYLTWSNIKNNQKIIRWGFPHRATIRVIFNRVNFFLWKNCHNSVNFVRRSKVCGKSDSRGHFT